MSAFQSAYILGIETFSIIFSDFRYFRFYHIITIYATKRLLTNSLNDLIPYIVKIFNNVGDSLNTLDFMSPLVCILNIQIQNLTSGSLRTIQMKFSQCKHVNFKWD